MSLTGPTTRILSRFLRQLPERKSRFSTPSRNIFQQRRNYSNSSAKLAVIVTSCGVGYGVWMYTQNSKIHAKKREKEDEFAKDLKLTSRERHFINFASVEYDGQIYMTPQDFLESFVEEEPRPRLKRRQMMKNEIDDIKNSTPPSKKGSIKLFRSLRDRGLISYSEYLFLLSILTKPETGFLIAFNMFDTDGNHRVDKEEFLVILHLLSGEVKTRAAISDDMKRALMKLSANASQVETKTATNTSVELRSPSFMEKIFSHAWADKHGENKNGQAESNAVTADGECLQRKNTVDTTLLVHFFGKKGTNMLKYEDFRRFMENLQTEVLEMEFQEFAKGATTISEIDFARILLRYTHLDPKVCNMYLDRLLNRLREEEGIPPGITFQEFKIFCQFLNNLEDFTIAMRMYTLADHPISKSEFHRAVKICTGANLSQHLVRTVFAIFDEDGDGQLSYREFIAIMKDRLHRGFKSHIKGEGWEGFKTCIKQEMKSPVAR